MARRGGVGGVDDLVWLVLLGSVAYVGYYAITGSAKGRVCGSISPASLADIRGEIAALVASYVKSRSSPQIGNSLSFIKTQVLKYEYALNDMAQKNLCQRDIDFDRSPPDFWKALASFILLFCSQHGIKLTPTAVSALNTMKSNGNGNLINTRLAQVRAYETIQPNVNPYGFLIADSIYNVFDSRYTFHYENQGKARELAELVPIANTDAPAAS